MYADQGNTARKALSRRKELQRLLDDVRADRIDIIIFKCLDRWFRNIRDYYKVQDILDAHHVDWECTQEKYNTTTTNGRLMLNIKLSVAQNESDQTSDRIKYINEGKLRRHEVLNGRVPFGYAIKDKHYVILPEQAEAVRHLFSRVIAGDSIHESARSVNRQYGFPITFFHAKEMLKNDTYIGTYHGIDDYHPAIISRGDFERVQDIFAAHPRENRLKHVHLFKGKLVCPSCGTRMTAKTIHRKGCFRGIEYRCPRHYSHGVLYGEGRCPFGGTVKESVIERYLVDNLARLLDGYVASFKQESARGGAGFAEQKKAAEGRLSRLKELYIDGMIEREEFNKRAESIQQDIANLDLKLLQSGKASPVVESAIAQIDGFKEGYALLSDESKREFWQRLIKRIELGEPPKIKNHGWKNFIITFA